MFVGTITFDLLLGDVRSLKQKRAYVRPIVAELRRRFEVAVAEVNHQDLHRRAEIGVAVVSAEERRCAEVLDAVEQHVARRPEIELLSTGRRIHNDEDDR
ncbi:DUF503 domain-containing protein [Jiangella asiatica]|uniref:DUF503 domain-containing protein n=1 Tax=Jiangella asiatica TaxID=2530372 RepID=A0A4R5DSI0_9ACTN|nr:DUF503 domain-containing protein [Jiangella asiatica]TDE14075.1 DUF503 domain-containing protein [Jiangella asiatica]